MLKLAEASSRISRGSTGFESSRFLSPGSVPPQSGEEPGSRGQLGCGPGCSPKRSLSLSLSLFHTVSSTVEGLLSVVSSDSVHDPSVGSHVLPRCLMVRSSCDGILGAWWSLSIAPDIAGHGHFPVEASSGGLHSCRGKPCLSKERADEVKDQVLGLGTCRVRNAEK